MVPVGCDAAQIEAAGEQRHDEATPAIRACLLAAATTDVAEAGALALERIRGERVGAILALSDAERAALRVRIAAQGADAEAARLVLRWTAYPLSATPAGPALVCLDCGPPAYGARIYGFDDGVAQALADRIVLGSPPVLIRAFGPVDPKAPDVLRAALVAAGVPDAWLSVTACPTDADAWLDIVPAARGCR